MKLRNLLLSLALAIVVAAPAFANHLAAGKVKTVDADKNQFVLTDNDGKEWTFTLTDTGKVRASDKTMRLNDLKTGQYAMVRYEKKSDGTLQASGVRMTTPDATIDGVTRGQIKSIDADRNQFVLTDANNKDFTFTFTEKGSLYRDDNAIKLNELKAGDHVVLAYAKKDGALHATDIWCGGKQER